VLAAAFNTPGKIVGIRDPSEDVNYPISLLSRAPFFFSSKPHFELCLLANGVEIDEDDEDGESSEEEPSEDDEPQDSHGQRALLNMDEQMVRKLMDEFSKAAGPNGELDRETFEAVFEECFSGSRDDASGAHLKMVLSQLFDIFDRDGNGFVSALEFQTGLSVLGRRRKDGESESSSIRRAFEAYDSDGNGAIEFDEMSRYLTSVFSVVASTSKEVDFTMPLSHASTF
jgi:Ca2+-binding EF-hand superfamily protein